MILLFRSNSVVDKSYFTGHEKVERIRCRMKITPHATGIGGVIQMFEHKLLILVQYNSLANKLKYNSNEFNTVVLCVPSLLVLPESVAKTNVKWYLVTTKC